MDEESVKTIVLDSQKTSEESKNQRESEELGLKQHDLELVISETEKSRKIDRVVIGKLVGFGDTGEPLVDFPSKLSSGSLPARSTIALDKKKIGGEIVLIFEAGDERKPIVVGLIQHPAETKPIDVEIDGERMTLTAKNEIVLRCGKASITLTRAGKILIRGAYTLSRSSGVNRIQGGSVQIN
ncbi:MAG: DUF6484 domain-containing protein [Planctomycetota bacterium]|jgi:hypothetical protein